MPPRRNATPPEALYPLPPLDPDLPILQALVSAELNLDLDKWFKKRYSLDFGMAHCEMPTVMEELNDFIQRFGLIRDEAKMDASQLAGAKLMKVRKEWSTLYEDKMTESTVQAVLDQDPELYAAWDRYYVLKGWVNRLENTLENLRLKLGAMRSFEATRRKSLDDETPQ